MEIKNECLGLARGKRRWGHQLVEEMFLEKKSRMHSPLICSELVWGL